MRTLNGQTVFHPRSRDYLHDASGERMCLSTPSFGILLAITVILFITSVTASSLLCYRSRRVGGWSAATGSNNRRLTSTTALSVTPPIN